MDTLSHNVHHLMRTLVFMLALIMSAVTHANNAGQVIMVKGNVIAKAIDGSERNLQRRDEINATDTIITGADSRVQIRFIDNALLALQENTQLHIHEYRLAQNNGTSEKVVMELVEGGFRTLTGSIGKGNREAYTVNTPVASIGVRGTLYSAHFRNGELHTGVWQGGIFIRTNNGNEINLGRDSAFSFGTYSNNNFRGSRTPPNTLDTGDQSDSTDTPISNHSAASGNSNNSPAANHNASPTAPTPFDQQTPLAINKGIEQSFLTQNAFVSAEELQAYKEAERYVVMVVNDKAIYGKIVEIGNEPAIFMTIENGKLNTYKPSESVNESPSNPIDIDGIEHNLWVANQSDAIQKENNTGVTNIINPIEWIAANAFIPNENHSLHQYEFDGSLNQGADSLGNLLGNSSVSFILDMATGRISDGDVEIMYGNQDSGTEWNFNFSGYVNANTGLFNTSISAGAFTQYDSSTPTTGIFNTTNSSLQGFLASPYARFDGLDPNFIGWLNLQASLNGNNYSAYGLTGLMPSPYFNSDSEIYEQVSNAEFERMGYVFFEGDVYRGAFVTENNKTVFYAFSALDPSLGDTQAIFRSNAAITPVAHGLGWGAWGNSQHKVYVQQNGNSSIIDTIQYADVIPYEFNPTTNPTGTLDFTISGQNFVGIDSNENALSSASGHFTYDLQSAGISNGNLALGYGSGPASTQWELTLVGGYENGGGRGFMMNGTLASFSIDTISQAFTDSRFDLEGMLFTTQDSANIVGGITAHQLRVDVGGTTYTANGLIQWTKQ